MTTPTPTEPTIEDMFEDIEAMFDDSDQFAIAAAAPTGSTPDELADQINQLADSCDEHFRCARRSAVAGFRDAVACGAHLLAIKTQLHHGEWLPWIEANFVRSQSTANNYMLLARETKLLSEYVNSQSTTNFSISIESALKFIRAKLAEMKESLPKPEPPKAPPPMFTTSVLLELAAVADRLLNESGTPSDWWRDIRRDAWRFRSVPERDVWRRLGEKLIEMSEAPDPPEEPDWFRVEVESQYSPVTMGDLFRRGDG